MCFSKEVSLATFLIGTIGGILCVSNDDPNYKIIGYFFIFVSLMQGIEYLLWNNLTCDSTNKILSYTGMILNHLQPVVLVLLLYIYSRESFNKHRKIILSLIGIYLAIIVPYSLQFKNECTVSDQGNLNWKWNYLDNQFLTYSIFISIIVALGFFFPNKKYGIIFSLYAFISYFSSTIIYWSKPVIGSMWCFLSAFAPFIFYLIFKQT